MFTTKVDRFHAMIHHTGVGLWTTDTVEAFLAAELAAIDDLGVPIGKLTILFDASKFTVQNPNVIALLRNPANPLYNCGRGAFVTPEGMGKAQIEAGNPEERIGVFETELEARRFLLDFQRLT